MEGNAVKDFDAPIPGVGSSYTHGWAQLWKYFLELFLIGIISLVISIPAGGGGYAEYTAAAAFWGIFTTAYAILVLGPVEYGVSFAYLRASRTEQVEVKTMFHSFQNYWNAVLASLLVDVIVVIGLFLLIVPGIIFACKLAFTPYLVVDRKMEVIEAIRTSWRMTNGHAWTVFLIGLLGIPILIGGLLCLGIGVIISVMWIKSAFASLYYAVSQDAESSS